MFRDAQIELIKTVLAYWMSIQYMTMDGLIKSLKSLNTASNMRFDTQCELKITYIKLRTDTCNWTALDVKNHNFQYEDLKDITSFKNIDTPCQPPCQRLVAQAHISDCQPLYPYPNTSIRMTSTSQFLKNGQYHMQLSQKLQDFL